MVFFWAAQAMETRDVKIRWANLYDCMHSTQKNYFEPRMRRGIGICNPRNVADDNADHRTALEIVQRDHETK
jgi:LmbE family N-acetylglucosaminyl deacetylase